MLNACLILNLPIDASDEEIRKRYLELVKQHPPDRDPENFRNITAAYEAIGTVRQRVKTRIFNPRENVHLNTERVLALAESTQLRKKRVGWQELITAAGVNQAVIK